MNISKCLLGALLLVPVMVAAQSKKAQLPHQPSKADALTAERHNACFNSHRYSTRERRKFFPFNDAVEIRLVSFEPMEHPIDNDGSDTLSIFTPISVNNFAVNYHRIIENVLLTQAQTDALTDLLFNVGKTPVKNFDGLELVDPGSSCYTPRNAILFINAKGTVTNYIEVCFKCHRYFYSSRHIKAMEYCTEKYDLLKRFFTNRGIKYGTVHK